MNCPKLEFKFAFLDEDEDPSVALERAKKEKKEKVKQAKIDSKKGPATSAPIAQPTKPGAVLFNLFSLS